jgi:trk system potassium uptake protein
MAKKQALVIGLGQFGMALARSLSARGVEVLAVDQARDRVEVASQLVEAARCLDATSESELQSLSPHRRQLAVCAMGTESREGSIICTALLRQLGAPRIVARATDPVHQRILQLVGAHEVVNPEEEYGSKMAVRLLTSGIVDELPIGDDLVLTELMVPKSLVGRTLLDLALPKHFKINVVALRRRGQEGVITPDPRAPLHLDDLLIVVSAPGSVTRMLEHWQ